MNRPRFKPSEGKGLHDINQAWAVLETAEHDREIALNEEFARLQKLEEDAKRFDKKAAILESWLAETDKLTSDSVQDSANVEASLKKHEAIMADAAAHEERVKKSLVTSKVLDAEEYHRKAEVNKRAEVLEEKWHKLNDELLTKRDELNEALKLQEYVIPLASPSSFFSLTKNRR